MYTIFGWVVLGSTSAVIPMVTSSNHVSISNEQLDDLLTKIWLQEEVPKTEDSVLTKEEAEWLRVSERRQSALDSIQCSSLRHTSSSTPTYYVPHHGVLRESSKTTKLRVVFNGYSKISTGVSLNDIQHAGAKLTQDITDFLLKSRRNRFIFMTDITEIFRQIKMHREDWPHQQILWRDSQGQISTYQLTTVTYGTKSAPFLACRVLNQLVADKEHRSPLAVSPLTSGRYVDDIGGGAENELGLLDVSKQVTGVCLAGGFPLAKCHSNSPSLL
ncbi:uncharacterized protein LOC107044399 [Diachasma alloeum]|uniref:uncharacterized protein LOC107044399 n=1 Tax=Diachasma alloeum TaxID=454923 RepID=UPI0007383295|nr:uncharacterized protein LOC107044399 [Diachasma alloeum]